MLLTASIRNLFTIEPIMGPLSPVKPERKILFIIKKELKALLNTWALKDFKVPRGKRIDKKETAWKNKQTTKQLWASYRGI